MKKILLVVFLLASVIADSKAQRVNFDSLKQVLAKKAATDTSRLTIIGVLDSAYSEYKPDSSIYYAKQLIEWATKHNDTKLLASTREGIAFALYIKGDYAGALDMALLGLPNVETSKDRTSLANTYNLIGNIYKGQENYPKALYYYRFCLHTAMAARDTVDMSYATFNLGEVFKLTNVLDSAMYYLQKAAVYDHVNHGQYKDVILDLWGDIYAKSKDYKKAIIYLQQSYTLAKKVSDFRTQAIACISLSNYYKQLNNTDSVIYWAKEGLKAARIVSTKKIIYQSADLLSSAYGSKHQTDSALKYLTLSSTTKDSLYSASKFQAIDALNAAEASRNAQIADAQAAYQNNLRFYLMLFVIAMILLAVFFLWRNSHNQRKANEQLSEQNEEIQAQRDSLENINRELAIESALERVRSIAMGMQQPDDMLDICRGISAELEALGVNNIRNVQTAIIYESKGVYINYEYYSLHKNTFITEVNYSHPIQAEFVKKMLVEGAYYTVTLEKAELMEWFEYQKTTNQFIDPYLAEAESLNYYWFSIGPVALGISLYAHISEEGLSLFKRFLDVFRLAYRRYKDVELAIEQTKEAQIELALEKVRAVAMSMKTSGELVHVCETLYKELLGLGFINIRNAEIVLSNDETQTFTLFDYAEYGSVAMLEEPYGKTPMLQEIINDFKTSEESLFQKQVTGKEFEDWRKWRISFGGFDENWMSHATSVCFYLYSIGTGILGISSFDAITKEQIEILKRFKNVFELSYRRYTDVAQAETQAKEARIELALERVRARTMAMQKSDELAETAYLLFQQFKELGENPDQATIGIINEAEWVIEYWVTIHGNQTNRVYKFSIDEPDVTGKIYEAWKAGEKSVVIDLTGKELYDFSTYRAAMGGAPFNPGEKRRVINVAFFSKGLINVQSHESRSVESIKLLERFAAVFEQTYTRFLDLQKAEEQAREATIEAGLEKVRSRSLAMHKSDELNEVVAVVAAKLQELGIEMEGVVICIPAKDRKSMMMWSAMSAHMNAPPLYVPYGHPLIDEIGEVWESGVDYFARSWTFEEKDAFWRWAFENTDFKYLPDFRKEQIMAGTGYALSTAFSKNSGITMPSHTGQILSDEHADILKRFAKVFEQAYIRFLDLQKAETQAREARIEVALERTRTQSMLMQHSNELDNTLRVFHEQVLHLGINSAFSFLWLPDEDKDRHVFWAAWAENDQSDFKSKAIDYPLDRDEPATAQCLIDWKGNDPVVSYRVPPEGVEGYFAAWHELIEGVEQLKPEFFKGGLYYVEAFMKYGCFGVMAENALSEEERKILGRFAIEFERAYTRFLDLQKAEAQAREARIEASLERVRSKTMAMHNSQDVGETAAAMVDELKKLGVDTIRCGIGIMHEPGDMEVWTIKTNDEDKADMIIGWLDMHMHPLLEGAFTSWRDKIETYSYELKDKDLLSYYNAINNYPGYPIRYDTSALPELIHHNEFHFAEGTLFSFSLQQITDEQRIIFKRFASVFGQTYRRYLDLKNAEAQARKAQIEAALERVRSRTLAMQKSDELAETAAVLFRQMIGLGIEPNRLYIGLAHPENTEIEFWITDEDGSKVSTMFTGDANQNLSIKKMYEGWKAKEGSIVIDMQNDELAEYFHYLGEELHVPFKGGLEQKRRLQYIAYFSNGFIGMASPDEQYAETIELLDRFAYVFNLTYTRFNDLKIAEASAIQAMEDLIKLQTEKKRAEDALTDLKAAQTKLIQSEKMASLGELTAGIAHEIQNPLNFVNNFSDVSAELIDEMGEELDKGDIEEAKAIASDIKLNLEKIRHHGGRADSIVKGMLQHSRSGGGEKQMVNMNTLADEFLRLSYHGLRAKDKSFNAEMITHFDPELPKITVIPQDMGRVMLNLFNNAFYAANQKRKSAGPDYKPEVTVSTSAEKNSLVIKVKDNGVGMSDAVKYKIMQPFFTTKPTGEGTGLGLSLTYDMVVKGHGGNITVDTKENEYTEFTITLPITA